MAVLGRMQIPVLLDRSRCESLTNQLIEQLRDAIRRARIRPGTRLPSSRRLSDQLCVSRNTVVRAYDALIVEGYVESRPASGIFVSKSLPGPSIAPVNPVEHNGGAMTHMPMPPLPLRLPTAALPVHNRLLFDFFPGRPSAALFPLKTWRRLLQNNLSHGGSVGLSQYGDPAGLPALRSAIADHLATTRGIAAEPGRVIVTTGAQECISIAARLFLNHGTPSAIEDPCYQGAAFAFEASGSEIISVGIDFEGVIPEQLPQRPTALLYLTPSHQYPTGHTVSLDRRRAVATWARRYGCYILEDDRDGDFRYEGSSLQAVAALAPDCTIYIGSFSRTLGAGLRLGYMVVPAQLAGVAAAAKSLLNHGNSWLEQAALAEMMRGGSYMAHLLRACSHYRETRDILLAALRRNFGDVTVSGESSGLHLVWYLPAGVPNAAVVEGLARSARIGVYSFVSAGAYVWRRSPSIERGLVLGYGALSHKQIEQGIARLSDTIDDAIDDPRADVSELLVRATVPLPPIQSGGKRARYLDPRFRSQPALATRSRRRNSLAHRIDRPAGGPMIDVTRLYRYPIKGLSAQPLVRVALAAGKPFPHDRIFALARPGAPIDSEDPKWAKKGLFVMLMLDEGLAKVSTSLDLETMRLTVMEGNREVASADLSDEADRSKIENLLWRLLPTLPGPPVLICSRGGHFMDKPDSVISLINLATVRSLEQQWGVEIDPLRFRANIYVDGARPWEEFDWVGKDIRIGDAVFAVDRKNGRCGATNVNPTTARRDLDIPSSLRATFGHKNLGVYLIVRDGGEIAVGNSVLAPRSVASAVPSNPAWFDGGGRRFICRGCYFIYEEAKGLPQDSIKPGTPFAALPLSWRCPDCGTDKATFRPYVEKVASG
ncbi:MAG TPA: aminotransferase class I/II-fold pyridoxal phosphate-dependent enzyme [Stellaceae bacterium]|nr:aminotransferase class I/II-fold pyridoxal phosphate-dependent enzyme [Stellaceae bacterium]